MTVNQRRGNSVFGSSKRTVVARQETRRRRAKRKLFVESLEDRRLLATLSEIGTTLTIDLDNAGEQVQILASGGTYALSSSHNFLNDVTNPVTVGNVTGFGTTSATITAVGLAAYDSIHVIDSAQDTRFRFANGGGTYSDDFLVSMHADTDVGVGEFAVEFNGTLHFDASNVTVSTTRNIRFAPANVTNVQFTSGNLDLKANPAGTSTGTFDGVVMSSTTISTTTGKITMQGGGGGSGSGVSVVGGSSIQSTSGDISLKGAGGDGQGLFVAGSGTMVKSSSAQIALYGSSQESEGLQIQEEATIETSTNIAGSGGIQLEGVGRTGLSISDGHVLTAAGDIQMSGTARLDGAQGVTVFQNSRIKSSGTGDITITGAGGNAPTVPSSNGISIGNFLSTMLEISTLNGDIQLTGSSYRDSGIQLGGGSIKSTGTGAVDLKGTGLSTNSNYGAWITSDISTASGDLTITGISSGSNDDGVGITGAGHVASTSGAIQISGSSDHGAGVSISGKVQELGAAALRIDGTTASANFAGVRVIGANGEVTSASGPIEIVGKGTVTGFSNIDPSFSQSKISSSGGGDIRFEITGAAKLGDYTRIETSGAVRFVVDGDLTEAYDAPNLVVPVIKASQLGVSATGNISLLSENEVGTLAMATTGGQIHFRDVDALTIDSVSASGGFPATSGVSAPGLVSISTNDASTAGQDLTINAGIAVQSTGANVVLTAGDDLIIDGNLSASSGTVTIQVDPAVGDPDATGGTVSIDSASVITTSGGAFLNGGDDEDAFNLAPQSTTSFHINGHPPVFGDPGVPPGDTLNLDLAGKTNPVRDVLATPDSGMWSFGNAQAVHYSSIESMQTSPSNACYALQLNMNAAGFDDPGAADVDLVAVSVIAGSPEQLKITVDGADVFLGDLTSGGSPVICSFAFIGSDDQDQLTFAALSGPLAVALNDRGPIDGFAGTTDIPTAVAASPSMIGLTTTLTNVDNVIGSGSSGDTLVMDLDTATTWNLTGANEGNVNVTGPARDMDFSSFENLTGAETARDTFAIGASGSLSGVLNARGPSSVPGGGDTLDYSAWSSTVSVDLTAGTATAITGGIATDAVGSSIEDVFGGSGHDTLVGDADQNALRGNAGDDTLNARAGIDHVDGGEGSDRIEVSDNEAENDVIQGGTGAVGDAGDNDLLINVGSGPVTLAGFNSDFDVFANSIDRYDGNGAALLGSSSINKLHLGFTIVDNTPLVDAGGDNDVVTTSHNNVDQVVYDGGAGAGDRVNLVFTPDQLAALTTADIFAVQQYVAAPTGKTFTLPDDDLKGNFSATNFELASVAVFDDDAIVDITSCFAGLLSEDQIIVGTSGADSLTGTPLVDLIFGQDGDDTIDGLASGDCLFGGRGNDSIVGGAGRDILVGGSGNDTMRGGLEDDQILGGLGDDELYGDQANDTIRGGRGNDALFGGSDEDWLYGGEGNDSILGELGHDRLWGEAGEDWLSGGPDNDTLNGGADRDTVLGDAGVDKIQISGTEGVSDVFNGGTQFDDLEIIDGAPATLNGFSLVEHGIERILGNGQELHGTPGPNVFNLAGISFTSLSPLAAVKGLGGDDVLNGSEFNDVLIGGEGNDSITGNGGADSLVGDDGDDTISGGLGNDTIDGGVGNDTLTGEGGNDVFLVRGNEMESDVGVNGGANTDRIRNVGTTDVVLTSFNGLSQGIEYFEGNGQRIVGTDVDNVFDFRTSATATDIYSSSTVVFVAVASVNGLGGDDTIYGTNGADTLYGDDGEDRLYGMHGNDTLYGGADDDSLYGGSGVDYLYGEDGADVLTGGANNDYFVFSGDTLKDDTITDMQYDYINLLAYMITYAQIDFGAGALMLNGGSGGGKKIFLPGVLTKPASSRFIGLS